MIPLTLDEIVAVVGGRSAKSIVPVTVSGVSIDSRTCESGDVFFAIRGDRFDGHDFVEAARDRGAVGAIVGASGNGSEWPVATVGDTVAALGKLACFHRHQRTMHVIAVTGSNGKTTTKSMIHHVLSSSLTGQASEKSFNNAIGVPLTLLSSNKSDEYLVVEIGTNAPGEIAHLGEMVAPTIGVITSIGAAHLERLGDIDGVIREKGSLIDHIRPGGCAVVPADCDALVQRARSRADITVVTFGTDACADVNVSDVRSTLDSVQCRINAKHEIMLRTPGSHNAMNAAATFATCRRLNLEADHVVRTLESFESPDLRLNIVRRPGITIIDDTYNANPSSTAAAIDVLNSVSNTRCVCVIGDMLELGEGARAHHEDIGRRIAETGIACVVGVGRYADAVVRGATRTSNKLETAIFRDTESACRDLAKCLQEHDTVLIKGSRRLGLDKLTEALCVRFEGNPPKE